MWIFGYSWMVPLLILVNLLQFFLCLPFAMLCDISILIFGFCDSEYDIYRHEESVARNQSQSHQRSDDPRGGALGGGTRSNTADLCLGVYSCCLETTDV